MYELFKYVEGVMKFVETIDSINAMPINDMLKKLYLFTFARGHISEEEAVTHIAYQNYLNNRKLSIFGGSNEIQRTIIAKAMLTA